MRLPPWTWALLFVAPLQVFASDRPPVEIVEQVVAAAGGRDKLLKLFRLEERLNVSSDANKPGNLRTSVIEPPTHWWLGKKERVRDDKEPAIFLVWAWTLGALTDPASKLETIPDAAEQDRPAYGLRISGTITPPMDVYFDAAEHRLVRIDWRSDIHRFSDWKEADGAKYPAKVIGYKKATGKPWYFTEITKLERLTALPEGLSR
jgi:hypothetical protein